MYPYTRTFSGRGCILQVVFVLLDLTAQVARQIASHAGVIPRLVELLKPLPEEVEFPDLQVVRGALDAVIEWMPQNDCSPSSSITLSLIDVII